MIEEVVGESGCKCSAKRTLPSLLGADVSRLRSRLLSSCTGPSVSACMDNALLGLLFLGEPFMDDQEDTLQQHCNSCYRLVTVCVEPVKGVRH